MPFSTSLLSNDKTDLYGNGGILMMIWHSLPGREGLESPLSMLEKFFSVNYTDRGDLFEGLLIWEEKSANGNYNYRELQGIYPVIS